MTWSALARRLCPLAVWMALVLALFATVACGQTIPLADTHPELKDHAAVRPVDHRQRKGWMERYEAMNTRVKQGNADLIFIGDSITHRWETDGAEVWEKYYAGRKAVNLGIGGDRTQHVLWRLQNGNLEGIAPRVAVVMIGTNNSWTGAPREIAEGVMAILKEIRAKLPATKILLLGIFPCGEQPDNKNRVVNMATNEILSKIRDGEAIRYLDIGDRFLEPDGTISKDMMGDFLHLTPRAYEIWAKAMEPALAEMLGVKPAEK